MELYFFCQIIHFASILGCDFQLGLLLVCAGNFSMTTGMITAHQLYNYITDHAGTYGMKPLRMSKAAVNIENKKGGPSAELHEYALVALWNRYDSSVSHESFVEIIK